jgi:hypothetical protein
MIKLFLLLLFAIPLQSEFTTFSFCRDGLGGTDEVQCIELDPFGRGRFTTMPPDSETAVVAIELSTLGRERFLELLSQTGYLEEAGAYDSGREVISVGLKRLALEGTEGRREAEFYLSTRREVMALVAFFDQLITQEMLVLDLESALQFDPLGIPERLDQIQRDLERDRFADAHRLIPMLERLAADNRVVSYARTTANRLKEQIETDD